MNAPAPKPVETRACPLASIATLKRPQEQQSSLLVGGAAAPKPGPQPYWSTCIGEKCMWSVPMFDEQGNIVARNCAVTLAPSALMGIQNTILQIANAQVQADAAETPTQQ